jgi:ankyrin repeat protein
MEHLNLSSLVSLTSESLILKQLFTLWDESFSCKDGYVSFGKRIVSGTTKALGIFLIQYLVKNPDKISTFFRSLIVKFIYRRLELKTISGTKDAYINKRLQKEINPKSEPNSSLTLSGLPMYLSINGSYTVLQYCPYFHQKFVDDIDNEANMEIIVQNPNKEIKTQCRDITRKTFVPDTLFPSKNYLALETIISNFFTVVNRTKMYKAQGILIDGEPGLGKSKSCDFLASLNKYHEVYYVNLSLTTLLKKDFKSIIDEVLIKRNGSTIIYFDELDKYLDFYIDFSFRNQEAITDFLEYKRQQKQEFLYQLLEVIETNIYEDGVVFIFCSNNFHTIFEDLNSIHFHSLKSRFAPIRFNRCDRNEIINFIKFFNQQMVGTPMYYKELDDLIEEIKNPISLTYRTVRHCHVSSGYNLPKFIELINEYEPEMSPRIEDRRVVEKIPMKHMPMKKLIEKKEKVKKEDIKKEEIKKDIWTCAKEGNIDQIRELVANGIDINSKDQKNECTALMYASEAEHVESVRELIKLGADVNCQSNIGTTALIFASGNLECVQELIKAGADINIQNNNGLTALISASKKEKIDCIRELIKSGADIDFQTKTCYTALITVSYDGKVESLKELIREGANINLQNKYGTTALIKASQRGQTACLEELIKSGADVNIQDYRNFTALMYVSESGHVDCVKELIKAGADVNFQNKDGTTALILASHSGKLDCIHELISSTAEINLQDMRGHTALIEAVRSGRPEIMQELIRLGADIKHLRKNGHNILMVALIAGDIRCVRELIKLGVDVNFQNEKGITALMVASEYKRNDSIEELLRSGANINSTALDGMTPLKYASIDYGSPGLPVILSTAKLLLEAGAIPLISSEIKDKGAIDLIKSYQ